MKKPNIINTISDLEIKHHLNLSFNSKLIHGGETIDPITGAVAPMLVRTKTYKQPGFKEKALYEYSRGKNPTRDILERKIESLCNGGLATVFASGVAAEASFLLTLNPGDHILCCKEVYGGTFRLFDRILNKFCIAADFVDFSSEETIRSHIKPNTKYLWVETPTNPSFHVIDLQLVSKISKETGIPYVADLTFSPPGALDGFAFGADVLIYSLSKYFGGHNDCIGGAIVTKDKSLDEKLRLYQRTIGAILSPDECYRFIQEIKTLDLRWRRSSENALIVANYLQNHPAIKKVNYPGLESHPQYEIAKRQSNNGFGAALSFVLKNESEEYLKKFVEKCTEHDLIIYGESLASPETILAYPPTMSHGSIPKDIRLSLGITDGFFRLSLGLEDPQDIISQLDQALRVI